MTVWSTKFINDLPDSSFLYARKRLFPYKNSDGEVDGALVESALTDIASSNLSAPVKANLMTRAKAIAKRTAEAELWSYIRLSEPYSRNSELPGGVRNSLPAGAQTIYRKAFNSALKEYGNEDTARKVAWAAVKRKYKKAEPKWVLKETDMGTKRYRRLSEAIWGIKIDRLKADVGRRKEALLATSAKREEAPAPEAMQESYMLPTEALSEVASWQQGDERILRNCTFIKAGLNKPKTRRWKPEVLEAHLDAFDGSLCYIDHPAPGEPRSLRALAGHTRNPRYDKATESVVGDIVLLDNNEAADYVVSVFGNETIRNSGAAGLSVLWEGGHYDFDVEDYHGRTIQVPTKLSGKCQVDFVANPTAFGAVGEV